MFFTSKDWVDHDHRLLCPGGGVADFVKDDGLTIKILTKDIVEVEK